MITGAADDDPSGIATYSQTGAQFGYGQLWIAVFTLPLMVAIQEACARIGLVTGKGIVAVVRARYSRKLTVAVALLVLVANTINAGADIGAMAAAARLVVPVNAAVPIFGFAAAILALEFFASYRAYARVLKFLALSLFAYVATVFIVREPWGEILHATFVPHIEFSFAFLFIITGVIGTTISPYMFFWEADEEVEETRTRGHEDLAGDLARMRIDNFLGMFSSNAVTWCIIVTAATVLYAHGVTTIATPADAARALEPLVRGFPHAGTVAKLLFAFGVIGLGLLAVPVLSGSASYAVAEALDWRASFDDRFGRARGFYLVIAASTLIGLTINFVGIDPMRALIVTAVINGVVAVPLIFLIIRISNDPTIMGEHRSGPVSNVFLWATFVLMGAAAVGMGVTAVG